MKSFKELIHENSENKKFSVECKSNFYKRPQYVRTNDPRATVIESKAEAGIYSFEEANKIAKDVDGSTANNWKCTVVPAVR